MNVHLVAAVSVLLREDWDPLGIEDLPHDEYDSYIQDVLMLLTENPSIEDLVEYLAVARHREMGIGSAPSTNQEWDIAEKILALKRGSDGQTIRD